MPDSTILGTGQVDQLHLLCVRVSWLCHLGLAVLRPPRRPSTRNLRPPRSVSKSYLEHLKTSPVIRLTTESNIAHAEGSSAALTRLCMLLCLSFR
jgi:hypothetical protein